MIIIPTIIATVIITLSVLLIVFRKPRVSYKVHLFIRNEKGELLLVYDRLTSRFNVPSRDVKFDEIPTHLIGDIALELYDDLKWSFDLSHHSANNKYDRIRDDTGPFYIYDTIKGRKKCCNLCYLLNADDITDYKTKSNYPWPEFYSSKEIFEMDADISPSGNTADIIRCIYN